MRTTINVDDDVLETARAIAHAERRPLGVVISMLARRGLRPHQGGNRDGEEGGFPVFSVDANAAPITPEMVQRALEEV